MRDSKELNKILDNIAAIRIGMLTTTGNDGHLHSRPMYTLEIDGNDRLWFYTHQESLKLADIHLQKNVNLAYADMHTHAYLSICGSAMLVDDEDRKMELWDPSIEAWFPDGPGSDKIQLLAVTMESAAYWDMNNATMVSGIKIASDTLE